jgi:hypothetical protein
MLARVAEMDCRTVEALIITLPAIIAAISSLLNGREQRRVKKELTETKNALQTINGKTLTK